MLDQNIKSDLIEELSSEQQELVSGGQFGFGRPDYGRPGYGYGYGRPGYGYGYGRPGYGYGYGIPGYGFFPPRPRPCPYY